MRNLKIAFRKPVDFRNAINHDQPAGGMFIQTKKQFELGEELRIGVVFPGVRELVTLECTVVWRRVPTRWKSALMAGIGVAFKEDPHGQIEMLMKACPEPRTGSRYGSPAQTLPFIYSSDLKRDAQRVEDDPGTPTLSPPRNNKIGTNR